MSKESSGLSVGIFRDVDSPDLPTDSTEAALDFMNERLGRTEQLTISGLARRIRITKPGSDIVDAANIHWPRMPADLNIVLTKRQIISDKLKTSIADIDGATGLNIGGITIYEDRPVAIVKIKEDSASVQTTTEHEIAHMLGLKTRGDKADGDGHCTDSDCIQYPVVTVSRVVGEVASTGLGGWLQKKGILQPAKTIERRIANVDFCEECVEQLGRNAFFLAKKKAGHTIPETLLW